MKRRGSPSAASGIDVVTIAALVAIAVSACSSDDGSNDADAAEFGSEVAYVEVRSGEDWDEVSSRLVSCHDDADVAGFADHLRQANPAVEAAGLAPARVLAYNPDQIRGGACDGTAVDQPEADRPTANGEQSGGQDEEQAGADEPDDADEADEADEDLVIESEQDGAAPAGLDTQGTPPEIVLPTDAAFFEPFETESSLDRFDFALHHTVGIHGPIDSWPGDHDANCGPPTTTRRIDLPGDRERGDDQLYTHEMGDLVYWCAPGGDIAKAHFMTSIMTTDYAQIDFAPKGYFTDPRRVCWDQNMTDLGSRKWTHVVLVPKADFEANDERLDYVRLQLEDGPGSHGTKMTDDMFMLVMRDGKPNSEWNREKADPGDWAKFTTADKARRYTTCVTDQLDGTVEVELERDDEIQTVTLPGAFPTGEVKVIFSDDNYNPPKDPPDLDVPDPTTWHWDNILVSVDDPAANISGIVRPASGSAAVCSLPPRPRSR